MTNPLIPSKTPSSSSPTSSPSHRLPPRPRIPDTRTQATLNLLHTGKWFDLTLKCGESEFKVHKNIVCSQSEFFEACVESRMKETQENEIRLVEEEEADVWRMLVFLYGGTYWEHPEKKESGVTSEELYRGYEEEMLPMEGEIGGGSDGISATSGKDDPAMVNARMFVLADKSGIPTLRKEVVKNISGSVEVAVRGQVTDDGEELDRVTKVARNWRRILDAVGYLCGRTVDNQPSMVLLDRLVARVPQISNFDGGLGQQYMEDLKRRCSENPDMAFLVVDMMDKAWTKDIEETNGGWKDIQNMSYHFFSTVETMIKLTRKFLLDPAKIGDLQCRICSGTERHATILPVLVDLFGRKENQIAFPIIQWKCNGCGYVDEQEEFAIDPELRRSLQGNE